MNNKKYIQKSKYNIYYILMSLFKLKKLIDMVERGKKYFREMNLHHSQFFENIWLDLSILN